MNTEVDYHCYFILVYHTFAHLQNTGSMPYNCTNENQRQRFFVSLKGRGNWETICTKYFLISPHPFPKCCSFPRFAFARKCNSGQIYSLSKIGGTTLSTYQGKKWQDNQFINCGKLHKTVDFSGFNYDMSSQIFGRFFLYVRRI